MSSILDAIYRNAGLPVQEANAPSLMEQFSEAVAQAVKQVLPPPYLQMPSDGVPFNEVDYVELPAIGATANIIQFTVPGGMNGVIKWIGNNFVGAGFTDGSGSLIWQITADGEPFRNHERIIGSLGSPASPSETAPLRVFENQIIRLTIQNVGINVAGQLCGGRLSGWFYAMQDDGENVWG